MISIEVEGGETIFDRSLVLPSDRENKEILILGDTNMTSELAGNSWPLSHIMMKHIN